jgi:signal transduction histidine kinase
MTCELILCARQRALLAGKGDVNAADPVEQVAVLALTRATVLVRAALTLILAGAGFLVVGEGVRTLLLLVLLVATTAASLAALARRPRLLNHRLAVLAADCAVLVAVLALSHGDLPYYGYAVGTAALGGILLDVRAAPLWAAQILQGLVVGAVVLRAGDAGPATAPVVLAAPLLVLLAGPAALFGARGLARRMRVAAERVAAAERSAAAAERARLARELHDSVAKTLRAMSLAAVALPGSLRRQPGLAEQLADVISRGADTASKEARDLIGALRMDEPDEDFGQTLLRVCRAWSAQTGVPARATVATVDPLVPVRYELTRILHEALTNVARHAGASTVGVVLAQRRGTVTMTIRDDGRGFVVPADVEGLQELQERGHAGLVGMIERAQVVGGELTVDSRPGQGTVVRVRVPS